MSRRQGGFILACADTYSSFVGARSCRALENGRSPSTGPFDKLRVPSEVEGLGALSEVERASLRPYGWNPKFAVENESALLADQVEESLLPATD